MTRTSFRIFAAATLVSIGFASTGFGDFTSPAANSQYTGGEPIPIAVDVPYAITGKGNCDFGTMSLGLDDDEFQFVENIPFNVTDVPAASKYVMTPSNEYDAPYNTANYYLAASCGYDPGTGLDNQVVWYCYISVNYD